MNYYEFSEESVSNAINAARVTHEENQTRNTESEFNIDLGGCLLVAAQCVEVRIENQKVCLKLPLNLGRHCFKLPGNIPNGTVGKACLSVCTKFGLPTGVKVKIDIGGQTVVEQTFGRC
jgi:hypothetical protein